MITHRFPRGFMPITDAVRCVACGVEMRRTGKVFPHVEFRAFGARRFRARRPECVRLLLPGVS